MLYPTDGIYICILGYVNWDLVNCNWTARVVEYSGHFLYQHRSQNWHIHLNYAPMCPVAFSCSFPYYHDIYHLHLNIMCYFKQRKDEEKWLSELGKMFQLRKKKLRKILFHNFFLVYFPLYNDLFHHFIR